MAFDINSVNIDIYSSGSTRIADIDGSIANARGLTFETMYPGGLFGTASFVMPRLPDLPLQVKPPYRVVVRNGNRMVYEGYVKATSYARAGGLQGNLIECWGPYGRFLVKRTANARWADNRITEDIWVDPNTAGQQKATINRSDGAIKFVPKNNAWALASLGLVKYTAPGGTTVARMTWDYDLQEGSQAWQIYAERSTDNSSWTIISTANGDSADSRIQATGTGSIDVTLGTASKYVRLVYYSAAAQTPTSDGTYYGEFSNIMVYRVTDSPITPRVIVEDVIGFNNDDIDDTLSSDTNLLETASSELTLEPFYTRRFEHYADIIARAAEMGDGNNNAWAFYLDASDKASDSKPVPVFEQWPDVTAGFDYQVSLTDNNLVSQYSIRDDDLSDVYNYINITYADVNGHYTELTPSDDSNLTDATSVAAYGRLVKVLTLGAADATTAAAAGKRYLARHKDPLPAVSEPVRVQEYITGSSGEQIPAANIRAGKRIKISDFSTSYVTVITRTQYDHDTRTCTITVGRRPDDPALLLAQVQRMADQDSLRSGIR